MNTIYIDFNKSYNFKFLWYFELGCQNGLFSGDTLPNPIWLILVLAISTMLLRSIQRILFSFFFLIKLSEQHVRPTAIIYECSVLGLVVLLKYSLL